jgi:hypothetical protein
MAHYQEYDLAAAHQPDVTATHEPIHQMTENERQIFDYLIKPDDSYDTHGVYWADMPLMKRVKFVTTYDAGEAARELRSIWQMTKRDPLEPIRYYFRNMVIPGAGLGLEGYYSPSQLAWHIIQLTLLSYVLFSIGNIKPLFSASFASCWKTYKVCNKTWVEAVEYLEICGIIVGQILVGILGDWYVG